MVVNPKLRIEDLKYNVLSEEFRVTDIMKEGWTLKSSMGCEMDQKRYFEMGFDKHCTVIQVTPENEKYLDKKFKKLEKLHKLAEAQADAEKDE